MSRFMDGDVEYPGQEWLWEKALERAMNGKRGQQVLRDLRDALLAMPVKRLIDGTLSDGHGVCAVGAYIVHKRVRNGERKWDVVEELHRRVGGDKDWIDTWEAEQATIDEAQRAGMQLTLACTIAGLNDDFYRIPEDERYERVLAWVEKRIIDEPVAA